MKLPIIHNVQELETLIHEIGFLPMFHSKISGFSLEECTPKDRWFVKNVEGPWEWREAVAQKGEMAYGKLFNKKTGFVSREWLPDFINYRRNGYDFEGFCEDGLCTFMAKKIMEQLELKGPLFSHELKQLLGSDKNHKSGVDNALTSLQMLSFMTVDRFEYKHSRDGEPYGWGVAKYTITENKFGEALVNSKDGTAPQDSKQKMLDHLNKILPQASPKELQEIIG